MPDHSGEITVVVAAESGVEDLPQAVRHVQAACEGLRAEILVACPAERAPRGLPSAVRTVTGLPTDLVPHLWARGIRMAHGGAVALTTSRIRVGPAWARALLAELAGGAGGVGGPIRLSPKADAAARAAYFLRYTAFMTDAPITRDGEIAGDNAAYARADLVRHADTYRDGFWEVEFHRRLRSEGRGLAYTREAAVEFGGALDLRTFLRHRFRHGMRSGSYRTTALGIPRWRSLVAAPLVPLVLVTRILRRARAVPGALPQAARAVPLILPMAGAWALGEAVGAWTARRSA